MNKNAATKPTKKTRTKLKTTTQTKINYETNNDTKSKNGKPELIIWNHVYTIKQT